LHYQDFEAIDNRSLPQWLNLKIKKGSLRLCGTPPPFSKKKKKGGINDDAEEIIII
jgi:hypothetical protein